MITAATASEAALTARLRHWFTSRPYWSLTLLVLAALGPFVTKPVNIDDPLFIRTAQQICKHPGDPYGVEINWDGTSFPMWGVSKNPPLACYYLALAGMVLGWSEPALHGAMLLPAIVTILGTYRLARHFCNRPGLAAGLTLFSPVFLISSSTLMCDTIMLAFWMWAAVWWVEGLAAKDYWRLTGSGILVTLAMLSKYFGICLVPLLLAYTIVCQRKIGAWVWCLAIPVAALAAFEALTHAMYGFGLFTEAERFSRTALAVVGPPKMVSALIALAFAGGCLATITFLTPVLWPARTRLILLITAAVTVTILFQGGTMTRLYGQLTGPAVVWAELQMMLWVIGGLGTLWLAMAEFRRELNPGTWLLGFWVFGTFAFAAFGNWTINGRSIQPLAPAVAILLARQWDLLMTAGSLRRTGAVVGVALGTAMAVLTTWADFRLAIAARQSAEQTISHCGLQRGSLWFAGHWGFQYYMEAQGGKAISWHQPGFRTGDSLAFPINNTGLQVPSSGDGIYLETILTNQGPVGLTTMHRYVGAGFYSTYIGPLPFAFGQMPLEEVYIYRVGPTPESSGQQPSP